MRMAKRTRLCNCWVRRWRWPSRAASSVSLWTKGCRWPSYCSEAGLLTRESTAELCQSTCWLPLGKSEGKISPCPLPSPLIEPLSERELEVLQLIAQDSSNRRDCPSGFSCALSTVKRTIPIIFDKSYRSTSRTEAVAAPASWVCCSRIRPFINSGPGRWFEPPARAFYFHHNLPIKNQHINQHM